MRANYRWLCAALLGCWLTSQAFGQQAISWQPNVDQAKRLAAQTNRLVLIHFWSTSCGPCQQMERDVFPRPEVAAAIEATYVPVKLNVDHFPATARQFGIQALPTDIVITPQGQLVKQHVGGQAPGGYIHMLNQIAANARRDSMPGNAQVAMAAIPGPVAPAAGNNSIPSGLVPGSYVPFNDPDRGRTPQMATQPPVQPSAQPAMQPAMQPTMPMAPPYGSSVASQGRTAEMPRDAMGAVPGSPNPGMVAATPGSAFGALPNDGRFGAAPPSNPPVTASPLGMSAPLASQPPAMPGVAASAQESVWGRANGGAVQPGATPAVPNNWQANSASPAPAAPLSPAAPNAASAPVPAGNPPLGMDGYCPVQLTEKERWVKGDPRWGLQHRGRTYLFAGAEEQNRFYADPDRYAPAASGNDVVLEMEQGQAVPGCRQHGVWFEGRVYLFSCEDSLRRFDASPYRYTRGTNPAAPAGAEANRGMAFAPGQGRY